MRFGIPFIISVFLLAPLAYYPSWLLSSGASQGGYLHHFFTNDDWASGPAWFIWVLLVYGVLVALAYRFTPGLMKKLSWTATSSWNLVLGGITYLAHGLIETHVIGPASAPAWLTSVIMTTLYCLCCTFTGLAALGLARKLFHTARPLADSLTANAYGIYVFHYVFVIWMQYLLLGQPIPPWIKFVTVFLTALAGSWLVTALLRKTPADQVL